MSNSTTSNSIQKANGQSISSSLSKMSKNELLRRDVFGRTILHVLIIANRSDLLRQLLKNPEIKCIITAMDYENGWNCLHYIIFHGRLSCYKVLLDHLKATSSSQLLMNNSVLFDMIRCKDRCRVTPLQLLDNDFKHLMWIPEYINEKSEIHLGQRYQSLDEATDKKRVRVDRQNWWDPKRSGSDIYVLGSNVNNSLGLGDSTDRSIPTRLSHASFKDNDDILDFPRFKSIKLTKNHSLVLTREGSIYSTGIGSRGRLGHGFENMNNGFRFKKVAFFDGPTAADRTAVCSERKVIKEICASADHSSALTTDNEIYGWGSNTYSQLGFTSTSNSVHIPGGTKDYREAFEPSPHLISTGDLRKNGSHIRGIASSRIHSLAYTKNDIFFWGLNIGQMGFAPTSNAQIDYRVSSVAYKGSIQANPRKISLRDDIKFVQTCDTCTCVITTHNDIHIYFQNQHVKLPRIPIKSAFDQKFDIFTPAVLSKAASISKLCMNSHEFIFLLLESGDIMSFSIDSDVFNATKLARNMKYSSVWRPHDRDLRATDIAVSWDGSIVLSTYNGLVFMKQSTNTKLRKSSFSESTLSVPTVKTKFKRIDFLNKVLQVSCDGNFGSFGFIRDDIDAIPLKLQSNDYMKDMEYLSPLCESNPYRKQNQLFKVDHETNSYITDYLYPKTIDGEDMDSESEDEESNGLDSDQAKDDLLFKRYSQKYDPTSNIRIRKRHTYQQISPEDTTVIRDWLKQPEEELLKAICDDQVDNLKHYDSFLVVPQFPSYKIKFHKHIFMARSKLMRRVYNPEDDGEYFIKQGIKGRINAEGSLIFETPVDVKALLIVIHYIYSNCLVDLWTDYPSGVHCPQDIRSTKESFDKLCQLFEIADTFGNLTKSETYFADMRSLANSSEGDIIIKLADSEFTCFSSILTSRSAYFETVLASRWNPDENIVDFSSLSNVQFMVLVRHLYGFSDYEIFDELKDTSASIDVFITSLLEIIQFADELLLFQLKSLCQLVVKDLITLDNVIILLIHSDDLEAKKLFFSCSWFIYNNLEIILLDPGFLSLSNEILGKLEAQINVFSYYAYNDFSNEVGELKQSYLENWIVKKSNVLVTNFLCDLAAFNENFMSDAKGFSSFVPLVDSKYEVKAETKKKEKRSSRKSSVGVDPKSDISIFRSNGPKLASRNGSVDHLNDFAIEEDSSFEVVVNDRRRKSRAESLRVSKSPSPSGILSENGSMSDVSSKAQSKPIIIPRASSVNGTSYPALGTKPVKPPVVSNKPVTSGLSPHSNWASQSKGQSILFDKKLSQPILGKSDPEPSSWTTTKPAKVKIGPSIKLSQKERKRLAQNANSASAQTDAVDTVQPFAWNQSNGSSSKSLPDQKIYPSLGDAAKSRDNRSPKPQKVAKKSSPQPLESDTSFESDSANISLTDIMIQESLKIEQSKIRESERKSLQEIQQEQEFAKWWEEESERVQQQMQTYSIGSAKPKGRRKSNHIRTINDKPDHIGTRQANGAKSNETVRKISTNRSSNSSKNTK